MPRRSVVSSCYHGQGHRCWSFCAIYPGFSRDLSSTFCCYNIPKTQPRFENSCQFDSFYLFSDRKPPPHTACKESMHHHHAWWWCGWSFETLIAQSSIIIWKFTQYNSSLHKSRSRSRTKRKVVLWKLRKQEDKKMIDVRLKRVGQKKWKQMEKKLIKLVIITLWRFCSELQFWKFQKDVASLESSVIL